MSLCIQRYYHESVFYHEWGLESTGHPYMSSWKVMTHSADETRVPTFLLLYQVFYSMICCCSTKKKIKTKKLPQQQLQKREGSFGASIS